MGKRRKKYQKQRKQNRVNIRRSFLRPFFITFCVVMAAGISALAAFRWIMEPAAPRNNHFQLTAERVVNGNAVTEKTQIDEIMNANDKYADVLNDPDYMVENNIYAKDAVSPDQVTITFAGDILFDENYAIMGKVSGNGNIANGIVPSLLTEMKSADIMMLNNEFPYSDRGTPLEDKKFTFRAKPTSVSFLNDMGVDIVSLANNHAYDYGETAFLDTMETLENAGITYVGAGRNLQEARRPVYYIINNMKIAIVAATQIEKLDHPDTKGATDS